MITKYEIVCGLEVHMQILSASKIFSPGSTSVTAAPNECVSFIDAGMPGMLPVLNKHCVEQAVKTGLGLNCRINEYSEFARKNYFYADLPQGYQITQFEQHPLVGEGCLDIELDDGSIKRIGIDHIHIEQDSGKSVHDIDDTHTFIDLNRAGVGLMELVTKPDFRTPEEAGAFLHKLRSIVRYLGTCDGNMDEGSMRCDVNVSVRPQGCEELRPRSEMKNINSVRFVMQAIESEAKRHIEVYESGQTLEQETRKFDPVKGVSEFMRSKEFAHDYRYFPEPDLPPLVLAPGLVDSIRNNLPELPDAKRKRFIKELGLSEYDAKVLSGNKETAEFFEAAAKGSDAKKVANWMMGDFFALLKEKGITIEKSPISPRQLGDLVKLIAAEVISGKIAKEVFAIMSETSQDAEQIVEEKGWKQETDTAFIEKTIKDLMAAKPEEVAAYKSGRNNLLGFFVGQVLKATQGKANPAIVNKIVKERLDK